jgi:hypothetical protein
MAVPPAPPPPPDWNAGAAPGPPLPPPPTTVTLTALSAADFVQVPDEVYVAIVGTLVTAVACVVESGNTTPVEPILVGILYSLITRN